MDKKTLTKFDQRLYKLQSINLHDINIQLADLFQKDILI